MNIRLDLQLGKLHEPFPLLHQFLCITCPRMCISQCSKHPHIPAGESCQTSAHCLLRNMSSPRVQRSCFCLLNSAELFPSVATLLFCFSKLLWQPRASVMGRCPENGNQGALSVKTKVLQICTPLRLCHSTTRQHSQASCPTAPHQS